MMIWVPAGIISSPSASFIYQNLTAWNRYGCKRTTPSLEYSSIRMQLSTEKTPGLYVSSHLDKTGLLGHDEFYSRLSHLFCDSYHFHSVTGVTPVCKFPNKVESDNNISAAFCFQTETALKAKPDNTIVKPADLQPDRQWGFANVVKIPAMLTGERGNQRPVI